MAGGEGLAAPGWERSTSLCRDCGQLECTEELLRARQDQARPAPHRGLSGQAFMETWSSVPGVAGLCILPLSGKAGWQSRGGKLRARRRCHRWGWEVGQGIIGKCPPPIAEVSATGLPSPVSQLGGVRDKSDGGSSVLAWRSAPGAGEHPGRGRDGEQPCSSQGGCWQRGETTPQAGGPSLYWPSSCGCCCCSCCCCLM